MLTHWPLLCRKRERRERIRGEGVRQGESRFSFPFVSAPCKLILWLKVKWLNCSINRLPLFLIRTSIRGNWLVLVALTEKERRNGKKSSVLKPTHSLQAARLHD